MADWLCIEVRYLVYLCNFVMRPLISDSVRLVPSLRKVPSSVGWVSRDKYSPILTVAKLGVPICCVALMWCSG